MKFIIEHLEPEMYEWCVLEYEHISDEVGRNNLIFTNVPKKDHKTLASLGEVKEESVKGMDLKTPCIMDPQADKMLIPEDKFENIVIGGILGNHPMDGRTKREFKKLKGERRNIGALQMSTDTAVIVVKRILDGMPFTKLTFQDTLDIEIEDGFHNILPYRYLKENGKLVLPKGFVEFLRRQEDNQ